MADSESDSDSPTSCSNRVEKDLIRALSRRLGPEAMIAVLTPAGSIDVLSENEVIEVTHYSSWKDGIGEVVAYGYYHPSHQKRLHLFAQKGDTRASKQLQLAKQVCSAIRIDVTFEEVSYTSNIFATQGATGGRTSVEEEAKGEKEQVVSQLVLERADMLRDMHPHFVKLAKAVWSDESSGNRFQMVEGKKRNSLAYLLKMARKTPTSLLEDRIEERIKSVEPHFCAKFYEMFKGKSNNKKLITYTLKQVPSCWPEWSEEMLQ